MELWAAGMRCPWPHPWEVAEVSRSLVRWLQPLAGAAVLGVLVWRLGAGPFLAGITAVDARVLAASAVVLFLATVCSAWRWRLVARGLGLELTLKSAVAASYRAQFLNSTLPGGILGDVHRGLAHGRAGGDAGLGLRAVAWERAAGQLVQGVLALALLAALLSPVRTAVALPAVVLLGAAAVVLAALRLRTADGPSWWARILRTAAADVRRGLLPRHTWPGVVTASFLAVAGYVAVFLMAARSAGSTAPLRQLLPLAVLVLMAMAVPASIAGWGPREGAAAWAFSAAGLGAAQGVSAAVVYGVLSLVSCLPGALVLVAGARAGARAGVGAAGAAGRQAVEAERPAGRLGGGLG